MKKKTAQVYLFGILIAFILYLILQLVIAAGAIRLSLSGAATLRLQIMAGALAAFCGSAFSVRRAAAGTLLSALAVLCGMIVLSLLSGLIFFDHIGWTGESGKLLLAAVGGSVLAGLTGKRGRKKGKSGVKHHKM